MAGNFEAPVPVSLIVSYRLDDDVGDAEKAKVRQTGFELKSDSLSASAASLPKLGSLQLSMAMM